MPTTQTDDPLVNSDRIVGVHSHPGQCTYQALRREALLFDQIGIPDPRFKLPQLWRESFPGFVGFDELDWLQESGIVRNIMGLNVDNPMVDRQYLDAIAAEMGEPAAETGKLPIDLMSNIPDSGLIRELMIQLAARTSTPWVLDAIFARLYSIELCTKGINACPILGTDRQIGDAFLSGTAPVLEVVLKSMPMPDDQTPWEDIIEFRNDPESIKRLRRLRVWVRKFAKETTATSLPQMKEEIEVLLDDYEEHMKLHRMKVNKGVTETLLTVAGKVAEDFVKLKWSELAKLPFLLRERRISLLEAEAKAPNRELAFISMARSRFSR